MTSSLLFITAVIVCCYATQRRYDGYKLLRTIPNTVDDVSSLKVLRDMTQGDEVDFWNNIQQVGMPVDMMVSPEMESELVALLGNYGLSAEVAMEDIQALIDDQIRPSPRPRVVKRDAPSTEGFDYTVYHPLDNITDWIDEIVMAHPNIASKVEVGRSHEGREISALKIGLGSPTGASKPVVWLQGGIHSREWISPATVLFITNELVSKYGSQNEITTLLDRLDIYIVPVFNVDGYAFTWTHDRLWRKTRSPNADLECIGTDANRNYDWHWGEPGASIHPCNSTYAGSEVMSEVEIRSVTEYMSNLVNSGEDIRVFIDFHSYSQMWMSPWGYTENQTDDFEDQNNLLAEAVAAVVAVSGTNYTNGTIANTMYVASGSSVDWAYGALGIKYSYTVELRDQGKYGFILPRRFIEPTAIETFEGLKVILNHIL